MIARVRARIAAWRSAGLQPGPASAGVVHHQAEVAWPEALHPAGDHRAAEAKRQLGRCRRGHRRQSQQRHRDPVVQLLVGQHPEDAALRQEASAARAPDEPLGNKGRASPGTAAARHVFTKPSTAGLSAAR